MGPFLLFTGCFLRILSTYILLSSKYFVKAHAKGHQCKHPHAEARRTNPDIEFQCRKRSSRIGTTNFHHNRRNESDFAQLKLVNQLASFTTISCRLCLTNSMFYAETPPQLSPLHCLHLSSSCSSQGPRSVALGRRYDGQPGLRGCLHLMLSAALGQLCGDLRWAAGATNKHAVPGARQRARVPSCRKPPRLWCLHQSVRSNSRCPCHVMAAYL